MFVADGDPIVCVASGRHRIDTAKLADALDVAEVRQAAADEVRAATGFAIGGVPPFGHDLPVLFDESLLEHERVWAAARRPTQPVRGRPTGAGALRGRARGGRGRRRRLASPAYKRALPNPVQGAKDSPRARFEHGGMETPLTGHARPAIQTVWVMVAAILVMFMQVGFMFLEIGFSRMKNVGTIVPKILANFSIAALCYWAVGFALAFGGAGWFAGTEGTFLDTSNGDLFPAMAFSTAAVPAKFFFQFVFCAVSLAIVWGTTIERIKFGAYLIYAVVFSSLIYPIISHWIFGGGWLAGQHPHAGLRRLDGGAPDRRHGRPGRAAAARARATASTARTAPRT